jgi:hypothetical protein
MKLSKQQTQALVNYIANTTPDDLDCDGCMDHLAEYVDHELSDLELPEFLKRVQIHLSQCPCCSDEHNALLEGLRVLEC